jgi:hypothetical protein
MNAISGNMCRFDVTVCIEFNIQMWGMHVQNWYRDGCFHCLGVGYIILDRVGNSNTVKPVLCDLPREQ